MVAGIVRFARVVKQRAFSKPFKVPPSECLVLEGQVFMDVSVAPQAFLLHPFGIQNRIVAFLFCKAAFLSQ